MSERRAQAQSAPRPGPTLGRVFLSEALKALTVRSTPVGTLVLLALSVGTSFQVALLFGPPSADHDFSGDDAIGSVLHSLSTYAPIVFAVLIALWVTVEYSSGMIRTSLTAVPGRLTLLAAKALLAVVLGCLFAVLSGALSYLATASVLHGKGYDFGPLDGVVLGTIAGNAVRIIATALLALAVSTIVRTATKTIAILVVLLFLAPVTLAATAIPHYLFAWPTQMVAQAITGRNGGLESLDAVLLVVWLVVPSAVAVVLFRHREV